MQKALWFWGSPFAEMGCVAAVSTRDRGDSMPEVLDQKSVTKPTALVVIGASAGGIQALSTVLGNLPKEFPASIVLVQHRSADNESFLVQILRRRTTLPVVEARQGESL